MKPSSSVDIDEKVRTTDVTLHYERETDGQS